MSLSKLRGDNISSPEPSYKHDCAKAFMDKDYYKVQSLLPLVQGHNDFKCHSDSHHYSYFVHLAAENGWTDIVELLVTKYDCNPHQRDSSGMTALGWAIKSGHLDVVKYFVSSGIFGDKEELDEYGRTWLHLAALHAHFPIVQYLVSQGYDVNATDSGKRTPLHWVTQNITEQLPMVKYLVGVSHSTINAREVSGYTPLHQASYYGHLSIVKYLVGEGCDIEDRTGGEETALHRAVVLGHLPVVKYLVEELNADLMVRDHFGNTPLHVANDYNFSGDNNAVIKYFLSLPSIWDESLIKGDPKLSGELYYDVFKRSILSHPVGSVVNVLLLGNPNTGKTTLHHAIKNRPKTMAQSVRSFFTKNKVKKVQLNTAGVIPSKLHDADLGDVMIYDFSGQPEYYSSHSAILESLLEGAGAVFVIVINLTEDLSQQVRYWSSVIINERRKASSECHIIVIGSHADKVKESVEKKMSELESQMREALAGADYAIALILPLDCRLCSKDLQSLVESLSLSCSSIRKAQISNVSMYSNVLLDVLNDKATEEKLYALELSELSSACKSLYSLYPLPEDIVPLLKILHSTGLIVYLENKENLSKSLVFARKENLLTDVIGILFAPSHYAEYFNIASSTGIITSWALQQLFPQYSSDMLIAFLKSMKLCKELDMSLLKNTNFQVIDDIVPEQLQPLFFPALITETRPQDIKGQFRMGWCLKVSEYSFSVRFLHVLLLHLAHQSVSTSPQSAPGLERQCFLWTNGIHWYNNSGVETLVEQVEDNQCVMMLMSCTFGAEEDMTRLHCELIKTIVSLQQKHCPILECTEYLLTPYQPGQLLQYPLDTLSQLAHWNMNELRTSISQDRCSISCDDKEEVEIAKILPIEPKKYLHIHENVVCLSDDSVMALEEHAQKLSTNEQCITDKATDELSHDISACTNGIEFPAFTPVEGNVLSVSDLDNIHQYVKEIVDWKKLGFNLGLSDPTLDKIEEEHSGDIERCTRDMLGAWLQPGNNQQTWSSLAVAVEEIDEALSEKMKTNFYN